MSGQNRGKEQGDWVVVMWQMVGELGTHHGEGIGSRGLILAILAVEEFTAYTIQLQAAYPSGIRDAVPTFRVWPHSGNR